MDYKLNNKNSFYNYFKVGTHIIKREVFTQKYLQLGLSAPGAPRLSN